ncbi:XdhC family protein [Gordonia westfalica]|uniref:XdhC family protein n=1 Tax=Gordonia westfalica TaxID=158898 RepID=A0ABU2GZ33_9ACTN|nr:XdhC family protein [Gordonia westfalica]MDS1116724.1 XdhC family protein [Gordonia westfalica]
MREIVSELPRLRKSGTPVAVATVVSAFRSAPRPPGATMVITAAGEAIGSVSGGCVEGAVYETGKDVLATGHPSLEEYGIADDDAFAVGLTCGGTLEVFVERCDESDFKEIELLESAVEAGVSCGAATIVRGPESIVGQRILIGVESESTFSDTELERVVRRDALGLVSGGRSHTLSYSEESYCSGADIEVFVEVFVPQPRMIVFGSIDFAAAVAGIGRFMNYHVTVCDARPVFTTTQRFPAADDVVVDWPHRYLAAEAEAGRIDRRTAVCVLTHDAKFDVPVLEVALRLPDIGYIGVMGSRRTHEDRLRRLRAAGLTDAELSRMCSPIGLDLGGSTPEHSAIAIAAEILLAKSGRTGVPLSRTSGPIHSLAS